MNLIYHGFNPDTTFYVYWDNQGKEHNEIPISQDPPSTWYDYTNLRWANIVTRNNGIESYYVWIPRYEYYINKELTDVQAPNERSEIRFIKGTSSNATANYKIPEAFWWDNNGNNEHDEGEELSGFWYAKYQLAPEDSKKLLDAEISAGNNLIRVGNITGTALTTTIDDIVSDVPLTYEYYLFVNGVKVDEHSSNNANENYVFTGLDSNTLYTVNIIARNSTTNDYVGAITKQIKTVEPYAPDLSRV